MNLLFVKGGPREIFKKVQMAEQMSLFIGKTSKKKQLRVKRGVPGARISTVRRPDTRHPSVPPLRSARIAGSRHTSRARVLCAPRPPDGGACQSGRATWTGMVHGGVHVALIASCLLCRRLANRKAPRVPPAASLVPVHAQVGRQSARFQIEPNSLFSPKIAIFHYFRALSPFLASV